MPLESGPPPAGAAAPSGTLAGARLEEDYDLGSLLDLSHLQAMADHLYAAGGIPSASSPQGGRSW